MRGLSNGAISLDLSSPEEAGNGVDELSAFDSGLWLNYTHVNSASRLLARSVYVRLSTGAIPPGFKLTVRAGQSNGPANIAQGIPTGEVELSSTDRKLIGGIQTTYTGLGVGKGHQLFYELSVKPEEMDQVDYNSSNYVQVLYTIAD